MRKLVDLLLYQLAVNLKIIIIRQSKRDANAINISNSNLSFNSSGGKSEKIYVNSNSLKFSVLLVPSWCSVQYFIKGILLLLVTLTTKLNPDLIGLI
jgi:hypothetical protein